MSNRPLLDADMRDLTGWLDSVWRWWLGELAQLVPQRLRALARGPRKLADYHADTGAIELRFDAAAGYPSGNVPVAVIVPQGLCLMRTIERPTMSQRDLESMLALSYDTILPLAPGEAVIAARIVRHDDQYQRMTAQVVAMPIAAARDLAAALDRMDRPCLAVYPHAPEPGRPAPVNLLPALRGIGAVGGTGQGAPALWLAVAFAFALNIGVLVWRDAASVDALSDIVSQQQPAVAAAQRIKARIARFDRMADTIKAQRESDEPLAILGRVAAVLPPGVWLQRWVWAGDSVRLSGYRPALADVSAALRRAGFSVVRYSETAATGSSKLGQPFEITLRLRKP